MTHAQTQRLLQSKSGESVAANRFLVRDDSSLKLRIVLRSHGLEMFARHPWAGTGFGHFGIRLKKTDPGFAERHLEPGHPEHERGVTEDPHSVPIRFAAETGLLGFLSCAASMIVSAILILRCRRTTAAHGFAAALGGWLALSLIGTIMAGFAGALIAVLAAACSGPSVQP